MKRISKYMAVAALFLLLGTAVCAAQQQGEGQEPANYDQVIEKQVNEMADRYRLDEAQTFKLDTLLQHYVPIYNEEVRRVKAAGASQYSSYQMVLDKWADFLDSEYQKIFTEKQWASYMKSYAGKEKKRRDKRMAAAREGQ